MPTLCFKTDGSNFTLSQSRLTIRLPTLHSASLIWSFKRWYSFMQGMANIPQDRQRRRYHDNCWEDSMISTRITQVVSSNSVMAKGSCEYTENLSGWEALLESMLGLCPAGDVTPTALWWISSPDGAGFEILFLRTEALRRVEFLQLCLEEYYHLQFAWDQGLQEMSPFKNAWRFGSRNRPEAFPNCEWKYECYCILKRRSPSYNIQAVILSLQTYSSAVGFIGKSRHLQLENIC